YFYKYVFYLQIHRYLRGSGKIILFNAVLILAFLVANILYITVRVKDISGLIRRSRLMSTINLTPLSLGAQINLITSRYGIRLSTYAQIHRWLGRVAIVKGLIYTAAAISL
ncbi:hypothetical protein V2W45_1241668, partial [Cenococcum geophilum]